MHSPYQQVRGRRRPTRRRCFSCICGISLSFPSPPHQNSPKDFSQIHFSSTEGLNIVNTSLLASTLKHPMLPANSDSSCEQLDDVVSESDHVATLTNSQKCRLHELESDLTNVNLEKRTLHCDCQRPREANL